LNFALSLSQNLGNEKKKLLVKIFVTLKRARIWNRRTSFCLTLSHTKWKSSLKCFDFECMMKFTTKRTTPKFLNIFWVYHNKDKFSEKRDYLSNFRKHTIMLLYPAFVWCLWNNINIVIDGGFFNIKIRLVVRITKTNKRELWATTKKKTTMQGAYEISKNILHNLPMMFLRLMYVLAKLV